MRSLIFVIPQWKCYILLFNSISSGKPLNHNNMDETKQIYSWCRNKWMERSRGMKHDSQCDQTDKCKRKRALNGKCHVNLKWTRLPACPEEKPDLRRGSNGTSSGSCNHLTSPEEKPSAHTHPVGSWIVRHAERVHVTMSVVMEWKTIQLHESVSTDVNVL